MKTLPRSLHRILLHPGPITAPWRNGFGRGEQMDGSALRRLAFVDSRVILFDHGPFSMEPARGPQKGMAEWMDRINGEESYWSA